MAATQATEASDPWADGVARIHTHLVAGRPIVLVSGPGTHFVLERLTTAEPPESFEASTEVIDVGSHRAAGGPELLERIADSLERRGVPPFTEFRKRLKTHQTVRSGQRTGLDRAAAAGQVGASAASSLIPAVGPVASTALGSAAVTGLLDRGVAAIQGSGSLAEVRAAFVSDLQAATRHGRVLVVLSDIGSGAEASEAVGLVLEAAGRAQGAVALVASAASADVEDDPSLADAERVVLARLPNSAVERQINVPGLDEAAMKDLVQAVGGWPDRLENVLSFQRTTSLDPSDPTQRGRYLAEATSWAEQATVLKAMGAVDPSLHPLALTLSLVRWFNRPIAEIVAHASGRADADQVSALLQPTERPYWVSSSATLGWQFADEQLRLAMQDEVRRTSPDVAAQVHRDVADHHRREMWRQASPGADCTDDLFCLPQRGRHQERWDFQTLAHEAEWCHHLLQLDPRKHFAPVMLRMVEAMYHDADDRTLELLEARLGAELSARQTYLLDLVARCVDSRKSGRLDLFLRHLSRLGAMASPGGTERALLDYMAGISQFNLGRPTAARRTFIGVLDHVPVDEQHATARQVRCLSEALVGLIDVESEAGVSGNRRLQQALEEARRLDDTRLLAEIHRLRARGVLSSAVDERARVDGEQIVRAALEEIDKAVAPRIVADVTAQLVSLLMMRSDESDDVADSDEPDRLLQRSLETYRALQDLDGEIELLCQQASLAVMRGRPDDALARRREALAASVLKADTHYKLATFARDVRHQVVELRLACATECLAVIDGRDADATDSGELPARSDVLALLALYSHEVDDEESAGSYVAQARATLGASMPAVLEESFLERIDALTPEDADTVAGLERAVVDLEDGTSSYRWDLGLALAWLWDPDPSRDGVVAMLDALWAGLRDSWDEPRMVADLVELMAGNEASQRDGNDLARLTRVVTEAQRLSPRDAGYAASLAVCLRADPDRVSEAVAMARLAHELEPESLRYLTDLARALAWTGSSGEALHLLSEAAAEAGDGVPIEPTLMRCAVEVVETASGSSLGWEGLKQVLTLATELVGAAEAVSPGAGEDLRRAVAIAYQAELRSRATAARMSSGADDWAEDETPLEHRPVTEELVRLAIGHELGLGPDKQPVEGHAPVSMEDLLPVVDLLIDLDGVLPTDLPGLDEVLGRLDTSAVDETTREQLARSILRLGSGAPPDAELFRTERARLLTRAADARQQVELSDDVDAGLRVLVGTELVPFVDPSQSEEAAILYDGDDGMLLRLRDWLSGELGFPIPGVRIAATETGARRVDVVVRGLTVARMELRTPWATPLSSREVERLTGSPVVDEDLLVGTSWTWLSQEQHRILDASGEPALDVRGILCQVLAQVLPAHASALLEAETVIQRFGGEPPTDEFLTVRLPGLLRDVRADLVAGIPLPDHRGGPPA